MELRTHKNQEQKLKRGPGRPRKNSLSVQSEPPALLDLEAVEVASESDEQPATMPQEKQGEHEGENTGAVYEMERVSTSPDSEFIPPAADEAENSNPILSPEPVSASQSLSGLVIAAMSVDENGESSNESIDKFPEALGMSNATSAQKQEVGVSKQPTQIHLIDGEKGGVGKSLFARVLIQFFQDRELPFTPIETDRSNSGVAEFYPTECKYAAFVEDENQLDKADEVYNFALEKTAIVDLPAQAYRPVSTWIHKNGMFELARIDSVSFYKWFVCDGGYDSLQLLKKTLEEFGDDINHILVKNLGKCEDWTHLDLDTDLQNLLTDKKVPVINFPKFYHMERNRIDMKRLSWNDALASTNNKGGFHSISRSRIKSFLREAHAGIASLKLFGGDL